MLARKQPTIYLLLTTMLAVLSLSGCTDNPSPATPASPAAQTSTAP